MTIVLVTIILVVAMVLLITEKIPVDMTSIGIIVVLMFTGILTPKEAISGFASPAVITVASMFLISRGMVRTGTVEFIAQGVMRHSRGRPLWTLAILLAIVGIASAFINNTAVVVLFIPIVLNICCAFGLSPSKFLIPVSYASILAGTSTLIGTSTNIIVSDISAARGFGPLSMFELSRLGVPIAVIGIVFLLTLGPRLMPEIGNAVCEIEGRRKRKYLAEFLIERTSPLVGRDPQTLFSDTYADLQVIELIRYSHVFYPDRDAVAVAPHDLLLIKGQASDLVSILNENLVSLPAGENAKAYGKKFDETLIVELILPPQSHLLGQRLLDSRIHRDPDIHLIAIQRRGLHYTEKNIKNVQLKVGDILLVRCPVASVQRLRGDTDFIIVEDVHHAIIHKRLARRAVTIFTAMVVAAASGVADIMACALGAAFLMIMTGCLQLRDAYRAMEGRVLLIIVGTFALSRALEKTGASAYYTGLFLDLLADFGPAIVLAGIVFLTSIGTQILSNNATAILILPIAMSAAAGLGVDSRPFIIGVCFGASACFATPIGYQTNLLVYGPGGYRFSDYLKLGIPLNLIVLTLASVFIPMLWPF